jgi:hypothetical protein
VLLNHGFFSIYFPNYRSKKGEGSDESVCVLTLELPFPFSERPDKVKVYKLDSSERKEQLIQ